MQGSAGGVSSQPAGTSKERVRPRSTDLRSHVTHSLLIAFTHTHTHNRRHTLRLPPEIPSKPNVPPHHHAVDDEDLKWDWGDQWCSCIRWSRLIVNNYEGSGFCIFCSLLPLLVWRRWPQTGAVGRSWSAQLSVSNWLVGASVWAHTLYSRPRGWAP